MARYGHIGPCEVAGGSATSAVALPATEARNIELPASIKGSSGARNKLSNSV
jgi:hypothetical protein